MKKNNYVIVCAMIFIVCILVVACGQSDTDQELGEEYVEGSDWQKDFGSNSLPKIQKAGNGYYFLARHHLYYYEESMKQAVPVCNKADCSHSDENCNAYMDTEEINYYDHKFYYISSENDKAEWYLYYLSEDGKQREKVVQLATLDPSDEGVMFEFCVHRGYAYISVRKQDFALKVRKASVEKIRLDGSPERTEVASVEEYGAAVEGLSAYGNTLVVVWCYTDSAGSDFRTHTDLLDIRTGEQQKDVLYDKDRDIVFVYKNEDDVYYYDSDKLYRMDMKDGKKEEVIKGEKVYVDCSSDGKYFYSYNDDRRGYSDYGIDVYEMTGEKVGRIPLEESMNWEYGDTSFGFAHGYGSTEDGTKERVWIFDKSQLAGQGTEWKEIFAENPQ